MEYRILGPLELADDGRPVSLRTPKPRLLLLRLLLDPCEVVSADALIDAVWGERPPASAPKLVQVYVSQLRRALGDTAIETAAPGYVLRATAEQVDAARFERLLADGGAALADGNPTLAAALLRRGLDLWRGRALEDADGAAFAAVEARRLDELRLVCVEGRLDADLAVGRHTEVLAELGALVAEHPLRDRLRAQLMLALYRCGRQADALDAYRDAVRVLRDELGLEPTTELRELEQAILHHSPALAAPAAAQAPGVALPAPSSPIVGRGRELEQLRGLVTREVVRIVTVSGAGGSGKTRIALELARVAGPAFANGAAFVELAAVRDSRLVVGTIAQALGVAETPHEPPVAALGRWLADRELLLVVDNFEHVVGAAPELALLAAQAPRLTVLVTSRRVLHVSGEHVFALQPLPEDDAARLFAARAAARDATAPADPGDEEAIRAICRRLDCLPLAIELAAARTATLTPGLLLDRLADRVTALGPGPRDAPARQQTLADTLAWSTDLLNDDERRALAGLSAFSGGCSLEAAETICGATLESVEALVDSSLLLRSASSGRVRFAMLETVREHAAGLLDGDGDRAAIESAHAAHYAALAEATVLIGATESDAIDVLDLELDNLRAGYDRAEAAGDDETALRIATALYYYWYLKGYFREGSDRIRRPLNRDAGTERLQALACGALAGLTWLLGDGEEGEALAKRGIERGTRAGALDAVLRCHTVLGMVARDRGELAEAASHIERSRALADDLGLGEAAIAANTNLAELALLAGDLEQARQRWEGTLAWNHQHGIAEERDGFALLGLGAVAYRQRRLDEAAERFSRALELSQRAGFRHNEARGLVGLAAVAAERGDRTEAASLLDRASRLIAETGGELTAVDAELYDRASASVAAVGGQA